MCQHGRPHQTHVPGGSSRQIVSVYLLRLGLPAAAYSKNPLFLMQRSICITRMVVAIWPAGRRA
jgi:hypothetical protein